MGYAVFYLLKFNEHGMATGAAMAAMAAGAAGATRAQFSVLNVPIPS